MGIKHDVRTIKEELIVQIRADMILARHGRFEQFCSETHEDFVRLLPLLCFIDRKIGLVLGVEEQRRHRDVGAHRHRVALPAGI